MNKLTKHFQSHLREDPHLTGSDWFSLTRPKDVLCSIRRLFVSIFVCAWWSSLEFLILLLIQNFFIKSCWNHFNLESLRACPFCPHWDLSLARTPKSRRKHCEVYTVNTSRFYTPKLSIRLCWKSYSSSQYIENTRVLSGQPMSTLFLHSL